MDILINKAKKLSGTITPPGSKSYTHRVVVAASLGDHTLIRNPSHSYATEAMMRACINFGADILKTEHNNWDVKGFHGHPTIKKPIIDIGNSGTALRISTALATLIHGTVTIDGDASLRTRHTKPLIDALNNLGSTVTPADGKEGYAPITIHGSGLEGGNTKLDGTESSQYLTSLLLVSPFARNDVEIDVTGTIVSKPYIDMSMQILEQFNIKVDNENYRHYYIKAEQEYKNPNIYEIPADYSQAAFPLAAGCLVESDITINGLQQDKQGDKQIIDILKQMGADIEVYPSHMRVRGPSKLTGIEVDLIDTPDLFPVLAVLGIFAEGKTRLYNMPQIRGKETDRIAVIQREFLKYGIKVDAKKDEMTIYHQNLPEGNYDFSAKGESHEVTDHRVSMALSLIGIRNGCAIIRNADSINISYPDYLTNLETLGVLIDVIDQTENTVAQRLAM